MVEQIEGDGVAGVINGFRIRHCREEDLSALEWGGEFKHFRRVYADVYKRQQSGLAVMWVVEATSSPDEVGKDGVGLIVGQAFVQFMSLGRMEMADGATRAYLHSFRVHPDYRNLGIGRWVMQTVEADLQSRHYQVLTLNVVRKNIAALRLYRRLGYSIKGLDPGRWSYVNHLGERVDVHEPGWKLEKKL